MNAQRLLDEDEGGNTADNEDRDRDPRNESDYQNSWGGSQYELEEEDAEPITSGDEGAETAPEGEDDTNAETVHISSMSVRMNAMRIDDTIDDDMPELVSCDEEDEEEECNATSQQNSANHTNHIDWRSWRCKDCGQNTPRLGQNLSDVHWLLLPRSWIECSSCED
jgi:hypothetical protein